jgi:predicted transcriptional regulator
VKTQRPSRLELYIEILASLEELQTANFITLQEKTQICQTFLKQAIDFLEKQDLIKVEKIKNDTVYSATAQGERVTRYFLVQGKEASCTLIE